MKKKLIYLPLAAAGLLLGACSSYQPEQAYYEPSDYYSHSYQVDRSYQPQTITRATGDTGSSRRVVTSSKPVEVKPKKEFISPMDSPKERDTFRDG